jgi:hypothetical protein
MNTSIGRMASTMSGIVLPLLLAACFGQAPSTRAPSTLPPAFLSNLGPEMPQAAAALRQCGGGTPTEKIPCYEEILLSRLGTSGVRAAMEMLEQLGQLDVDVKRDGHVYAHAIGIASYRSAAEAGQTFAQCTPIYQSGCYHGVIQAYFTDLQQSSTIAGIGADEVNALCRDYREDGADRWLLFQCAHGMGHGLVMFHGYDLPRALQGCDHLTSIWEQEGCYAGAFMENIVNATAPHHAAGSAGHHARAAAPSHEHGDAHAHDGDADAATAKAASPWKALDEQDPHYPCSVLDTRYQSACYSMQTSVVLLRNNGDIAGTATFCESAPARMRNTCFQSLGRDVSARTLQDHAQSVRMCALVREPYQPWCHTGVVKNFVDLTADAADGFAYCRSIPDAASKARCYQAVGEQVWVLEDAAAGKEQWCGRAESGYVAACRIGAGLTDQS